MDSTSNSQNPQQDNSPIGQQPTQPVQQQPLGVPSLPQPPIPSQPVGNSAQFPTQQPVVPELSVQNPVTPPIEGPRITLHDLYGPSGFAQDTPQDQGPQPLQAPAQPVIQPAEPVSAQLPPVPAQALPTQPSPEPIAQPIPTAPIQEMPPTPIVQEQAQPAVQQIQTVENPNPPMQPISETPVQQDVISQDMPLRKQAVPEPSIQDIPVQDPSDNPPPEENKKSFLNKFLLLRILFGGLGVIVFIVIILFVVQFFSNFSNSSTNSGKVTLTYWGLWEDANTMQSVISQFESSHPNISINYVKEDPKDYSERVLTRIQDGNGPDIFTYHSSWLPMVQAALVPLSTSVVSKDALEKDYYPVVKNDLVKNGALYGVPLGIDTLSLFVNNSMLKSAKLSVPTTWDNFITVARALTVKDAEGKIKVAGAALGTFDNITHAPDILATLFMQNGVDVTTMKPSSNAADALSFYTSFATGDSNVWDNTLDPSQLAFARGNLAMYFGYSWDIFLIKASNPSLDFSIFPIPHLPGRNTTAASYWVEGISSKSTHQKEALEFMQYLAQKNTLAVLYSEEAKTRLFGEPYPQVTLGNTLKENPLVYPFVEQANDAKSTFFSGETDDTGLNGQMNAYLGNAVRGALGNTSPQSAIDTLTQGVVQIEKQYAGS